MKTTLFCIRPIALSTLGLVFMSSAMAQQGATLLTPKKPQQGAYVGYSVAMDGKFAVAGAYMEDVDNFSSKSENAGAAYIYVNTGGNNWSELQRLTPIEPESNSCFGNAVAIAEDKIIVGAQVSDEMANNAGCAYIFERDHQGLFTQKAQLVASDAATYEFFGYSVAMSDKQAFVGAIQDGTLGPNSPVKGNGAVYVFESRFGQLWLETQKITAPDAADEDYFGYCISVSGDYLFIGSYAQDTDEKNANFKNSAGAVYVYQKTKKGEWEFRQKLVASDREVENYFGSAISVSGKFAAIGAHQKNAENVKQAGAVYIFRLDENGNWKESDKIVDANAKPLSHFGYSVSLSGTELIAGSCFKLDLKNDASPQRGFASRYVLNEGKWIKAERITHGNSYDNWMGYSVAIDNGKFIVGAHKNGEGELEKSGAVYFKSDCKATQHLVEVTTCTAYEFHGRWYDRTGSYEVIVPNKAGCDSIITLKLTIPLVETAVVVENEKLVAKAENATYKWISLTNNTSVPKSNKKYFTPVQDGNYAVMVTQNGCTDTSAAQTFFKMDMDKDLTDEVNVFPNPVNDLLNIQLKGEYDEVTIALYDLNGKLLYQQTGNSTKFFTIDVSGFPVATYLMNITAGEKNAVVKVVKN